MGTGQVSIPEHARTLVLTRLLSVLWRWGLTADEVAQAAKDWNESRNDPPLSDRRVAHVVRHVTAGRGVADLQGEAIRDAVAEANSYGGKS